MSCPDCENGMTKCNTCGDIFRMCHKRLLESQEPITTPKTQEVATQDLLDALKGLYRLVEGTSGELYETMNPYSCWQMQKAGRLLNQAHGVSTKSAIFDGEG